MMSTARKTGEQTDMAALPEVAAAIIIDMCEEVVGVATGIFLLVNDSVRTVLHGIETVACRPDEDIALPVLEEGIDTGVAAVGERITHEVIAVIVVAHQSLRTAYPQPTAVVDKEVGDGVVGDAALVGAII